MKKIKKYYYNMNIQHKLVLMFLLVVLVPMISFLLLFSGRLYSMIVADTIQKQQNISLAKGPEMNQILTGIENTAHNLQSGKSYEVMIGHDTAYSFQSYKKSMTGQTLLKKLSLKDSSDHINAIHLYVDLPSNHPIFLDPDFSKYVHSADSIKQTYWYGIFQGTNCTDLHCPSFYLSNNEIENYGNVAFIDKSYLLYHDVSVAVYTAIFYSSDIFMNQMDSTDEIPDSVSYIINPRDSIVAATDDALAGTYTFSYSNIQEASTSSNNFISKKILGQTVYVGYYYLESSDWFWVIVIPSAPLTQKSMEITWKMIFIYVLMMIFAAFVAIQVSRSMTKRLSLLVNRMVTVKTEVPKPLEPSPYHDEIGELILTYNHMSTMIQKLLEDQIQSAERIRITELNALQAQINPHFLYNTMEMINWLALDGEKDKVTDAVQNLSRFYKLTLSRKENFNTLENELIHVTTYVYLQNMRFKNQIDLLIDIPDELMDYRLPKLTLQPIIENSILHGIMEKPDKQGSIVISGWQNASETVILVSDNGVGMSKEQLAHILLGTGHSKKGTNIAIYNTHERIRLLFGEEYGLIYSSVYGEGTDVEIHLPPIVN